LLFTAVVLLAPIDNGLAGQDAIVNSSARYLNKEANYKRG
jgi:hypothetical protein